MSCGNRTEEQVERKGDKTAIVFRDPCSERMTEESGRRNTVWNGSRARASWGAGVLRPYTRQVLEFAQGHGHWAGCGADCRGQGPDDTHEQGEDHAAEQQARSDFEGEGHVAERLPVHRGGCQAVEWEYG